MRLKVQKSAEQRLREYGVLAAVNLRAATSVHEQVAALGPASRSVLIPIVPRTTATVPSPTPPLDIVGVPLARAGSISLDPADETHDVLQLRLRNLTCVRPVRGELFEFDNNAMSLSAVATDPSGNMFAVPVTNMGSFVSGTNRVRPTGIQPFVEFEIATTGVTWPKSVLVTFLLAERDTGGGIGTATQRILDKIRDVVSAAITAAVTAGLTSLSVPAAISKAIGDIVGWVFARVWDYLVEVVGDDVFRPRPARVSIPSATARFPNNELVSEPQTLSFTEFSADNELEYEWRLATRGHGYTFVNQASGKVLDVTGGSLDDGAPVIQWSYWNGPNQRWQLVPNGIFPPTVRIVAEHSGKVLEVAGGSRDDGAQVQKGDWTQALHQQWWVLPADSGLCHVINPATGKALEVYASSRDTAAASTSGPSTAAGTRTGSSRSSPPRVFTTP
jgi:hypothetical protein